MSWTDDKAARHHETGERVEREAKERYKARVAELEAALTRINHGEGRTATDLQRIAASALAQKGEQA